MTAERTPEEDEAWTKVDLQEAADCKSGKAERDQEAKLLREQIRRQGIFEKDERPNEPHR